MLLILFLSRGKIVKKIFLIFLLLLCACTSNKISENIESNTDTHGIIIPAYIYPNDSIYDKIIESSSKLNHLDKYMLE